ncbi:hypothetical protein H310_01538 [Aphanomyces invadans]|uniref:Palmitoyltransferase n=1 Tax=Aphanomyces invadans TaxID=157072 RepID=A0A024UTU5_9STRA|nr:hypothetical protein H310_01538 [Aphanomyces invadans]ETW09078.1 hypothetical protein H310_01538 [Aphanomyces invadans]|eukprot:XP_008862883.1 hypothetical protein H310_01538 [Aphanomyces invadans]
MWFVWDAGIAVSFMGLGCMLACVLACMYNLSEWLGATVAGVSFQIMLLVMSGWALSSHWYTMTTNPGTIPKSMRISQLSPVDEKTLGEPKANEFVYCETCDALHPKRAEHCHTCQSCVVLMDHHCPWVNNCIGIGNAKNFILLLLYVAMLCAAMIVVTVLQLWTCTAPIVCGLKAGASPGRAGMWVLAVSSLFLVLCSLMLAMEIFSISEDEIYGAIASDLSSLQESREHGSKLSRHLGILFGNDMFQWHWLVPGRNVHRRRRDDEMDIILGYREGESSHKSGIQSLV